MFGRCSHDAALFGRTARTMALAAVFETISRFARLGQHYQRLQIRLRFDGGVVFGTRSRLGSDGSAGNQRVAIPFDCCVCRSDHFLVILGFGARFRILSAKVKASLLAKRVVVHSSLGVLRNHSNGFDSSSFVGFYDRTCVVWHSDSFGSVPLLFVYCRGVLRRMVGFFF